MTEAGRHDSLRALLARRVKEVVDRVASGEEPSKDEVDALDRLGKLATMEQSILRSRQRRIAGLALLALAVVAATLVLTVRVWWDSDVAVDATVTALSFVPAEQAYLTGPGLGIERLELRDIDSVRAMQLRNRRDTTLLPRGQLILTPRVDAGTRSYLTMSPLSVAESSLVRLRVADSGLVRADFRAASGTFDVSVASVIDVLSGDGTEALDFDRTGQLRVFHGADPIAVSWRGAGGRFEMPTPMRVTGLELFAIDGRNGERISTLQRGAVYRESLGRDSVRLRRDETLTIERPRGLLRALVVQGNDIGLFFRGRAGEMATATGGEWETLRPTLLEWARAQNGVWWLWTTVLGIAGVLLGVRRWWREPK